MTLYYYEELTLKEIGMILDITESQVSQIHTKTILKLQAGSDRRLEGAFVNLHDSVAKREFIWYTIKVKKHTAVDIRVESDSCYSLCSFCNEWCHIMWFPWWVKEPEV